MAGTCQVLFVQGGGAGVHDEWDHRLVDSLRKELGDGYDIRYPQRPPRRRMPACTPVPSSRHSCTCPRGAIIR